MKKMMNSADVFADEMLDDLCKVHPGLMRDAGDPHVISPVQ
jgi:hypothetical protein